MTRMTLIGAFVACVGWITFSASESVGWDDQNERSPAAEEHDLHERAEVTRAVCVLQPVGDSEVH